MRFIKQLLPVSFVKTLRPYGHGALALLASVYFRRPSSEIVVVGVTGTNGKSTTVNLLAAILREAGIKTGFTSTVSLDDGQSSGLNTLKMTMPSGVVLQRLLRSMVDSGCKVAVLEVSSEGLAQNRHLGIDFDVAVFTNLTPEHIDSHGSFENYRQAKARLFKLLGGSTSAKKQQIIANLKKTIVTNVDSENGSYYGGFPAEQKLTYGVTNHAMLQAAGVSYSPDGVSFTAGGAGFALQLKGQFDVYNALAATAAAGALGISTFDAATALAKVSVVPGRVEVLQREPFTVVVDYAYEPEEMRQLYETVDRWKPESVIQVLGPTGGGRDHARIRVLGEMAARHCRHVLITTDDPYDSDPVALAKEMLSGAAAAGSTAHVETILDRRSAIAAALTVAKHGDIVLITGKGADQRMALAGGNYIPWDDRTVVKEELENISKK